MRDVPTSTSGNNRFTSGHYFREIYWSELHTALDRFVEIFHVLAGITLEPTLFGVSSPQFQYMSTKFIVDYIFSVMHSDITGNVFRSSIFHMASRR